MLLCEGEGGGVKLQAASEDTASSSEQTACRHGNAAPNLQVTVRGAGSKQSLGRKGGREEAEGEGCRGCECCRQRKSAVPTCPDAVDAL